MRILLLFVDIQWKNNLLLLIPTRPLIFYAQVQIIYLKFQGNSQCQVSSVLQECHQLPVHLSHSSCSFQFPPVPLTSFRAMREMMHTRSEKKKNIHRESLQRTKVAFGLFLPCMIKNVIATRSPLNLSYHPRNREYSTSHLFYFT